MKRLFLMGLLALWVPATPVGTAQDGYVLVQQCNGPNCVARRTWSQPVISMPTVSEVIPMASPASVVYSEPLPAEPVMVSPPSSVPVQMWVPMESVPVAVNEVVQPVELHSVSYAAPVYQEVQVQTRPLMLPRLLPRIRANRRNRVARRWSW